MVPTHCPVAFAILAEQFCYEVLHQPLAAGRPRSGASRGPFANWPSAMASEAAPGPARPARGKLTRLLTQEIENMRPAARKAGAGAGQKGGAGSCRRLRMQGPHTDQQTAYPVHSHLKAVLAWVCRTRSRVRSS